MNLSPLKRRKIEFVVNELLSQTLYTETEGATYDQIVYISGQEEFKAELTEALLNLETYKLKTYNHLYIHITSRTEAIVVYNFLTTTGKGVIKNLEEILDYMNQKGKYDCHISLDSTHIRWSYVKQNIPSEQYVLSFNEFIYIVNR